MDWYKNFNPDPIIENIGGITYVEAWLPVQYYEAFYCVSTFGRVMSVREGKIMRQYKNEKGYLTIGFQKEKGRKKFKVHRLVGIAFIENPLFKPEINHNDFDKTNNFYLNLSWATPKENTDHARKGGRRPIAILKEKIGEHPVKCQKVLNSETGKIYESVFQLCDEIKAHPKEVRRKLSGERVNNTPYRWLKGQWTLFYRKRHAKDLARYHELKPIIYGTAI